MTTTIKNAESAALMAQARHKKWLENFLVRYLEPYNDMAFVTWWSSIPYQIKEQMMKANPEAFGKVEEKYKMLGGK